MDHVDNSGNIYDADNAIAAVLEALGRMRASDAEVFLIIQLTLQ